MHYLVGGGVASLSAAAFLIRDAGVRGEDIRIFEQTETLGGSLDGAGDAAAGYLVRGGRMFEENFQCAFDLFASIPSPEGGSILDDIHRFNREVVGSSRCRLVRQGARIDAPPFGLSWRDRFDLLRLTATPESALEGRPIDAWFAPSFFESNFWIMWSTTFAFREWHSAIELRRYFKRFIHLFPGFKRIEGVLRTRFNQYDSLIEPLAAWLAERGVRFETGRQVVDAEIGQTGSERAITALHLAAPGASEPNAIERLDVLAEDRVYITLGSMTDATTTGSNAAPPPAPDEPAGAWALWRRLAARDACFGRPEAFCGDTDRSTWSSFTVTLRDPAFFEHMERFSGNATGTGGLVTIAESGWMLSIVLFHQPHFRAQPQDAYVFWGYGLHGDRPGDAVKKPMAACGGDEILQELAAQLRLGERADALFKDAIVIPCRMPFITSQFMPRRKGDRPAVTPEGAANFALLGQFCEMPDDTVFTVEYSVRSAMAAVHALTGKGRPPPPVRRTDRDPGVLWRAAKTVLRG